MSRKYSHHELLADETNRVFLLDSDLENGELTAGLITVFPYVNSPVTVKDEIAWMQIELPEPMIMSRSPITTFETDVKVLTYGYIS